MTTNKLLYVAETWDRVYKAFEQVNFTAYDYDSVKQSLLDYLKLNYPENFNDYIESSQLIALIELFSYVAEQHSYRVDMTAHENLMPTAQRKQSILRLAKLISYTASRNLPLRGLVKVTSVSVSEDVRDSQGNSLANRVIKWADPSNSLWREQFQLVMNRLITKSFGDPYKSMQVDDTVFQQYELSNVLEVDANATSFVNGTLPIKLNVNGAQTPFELVPSDIDENGVFERSPNPRNYFSILYGDDGFGDGSSMTGFMMFIKQGTLKKTQFAFDAPLPNRILDIAVPGVNDVDVWLQEVSEAQELLAEWDIVQNINGQNLAFNTLKSMKKYEVETLENDSIRVVFGSGDFSEIPVGFFNLWVRSSDSGGMTVSKELLMNQALTFAYTSKQGNRETCTLSVSLVSALQNSAPSEDIEHIRSAAPAVYYAQDRMVNGQDYNSYMLQDSSILRLKAVNRTFAGQPKYIEWNDASGAYQNVKVFGDDSRMYYDISQTAETSTLSSRSLIDELLEPALSDPGIYNLLVYAFYESASPLNLAYIRPRTKFIEDVEQEINGFPLQEKTLIQGALDRHWYGEPDYLVSLGPDFTTGTSPKTYYGVVNEDTDQRVYDANIQMVTVASNIYTPVPLPGYVSGVQEAATRQMRFGIRFKPDRSFASELVINSASVLTISSPDLLTSADITQGVAEEETWTIEIVDATLGTFSVFGSHSGIQSGGTVGTPYDNGLISFIIDFPPAALSTALYIGDAFIITVIESGITFLLEPTIYKKNLTGVFELIDESILSPDAETLAYDVNDEIASWVLIVQRVDDVDGNVSYWRLTRRNFQLIIESPTTKFWYNEESYIVDPDTKKRVHDLVKLLKSNLSSTGTPLGTDQAYFVVGPTRFNSGEINYNSLLISPSDVSSDYYSGDGRPAAPFQFLDFIGDSGYVYFSKNQETGDLTPIPTTVYLETLEYTNDESGIYVRKLGRDDLDFLWLHYAPNENMIDPSTSNLVDMFVLTRGYYSRMADYLRGITALEPVPPTPFELRTSYRTLLESKMISDTVVLHPAKIKLLFGDKAVPELRAKLKLVKAPSSKLTEGQLRVKVLDIINAYFSIENWDFAQDFYGTELSAVIHKSLAPHLLSVVLVPEFPNNWFGDLLYVRSAPDEIFMSAAELKDIMVIGGIDHVTLRQKP